MKDYTTIAKLITRVLKGNMDFQPGNPYQIHMESMPNPYGNPAWISSWIFSIGLSALTNPTYLEAAGNFLTL